MPGGVPGAFCEGLAGQLIADGARKGLADTALRTGGLGVRDRLVDVAQELDHPAQRDQGRTGKRSYEMIEPVTFVQPCRTSRFSSGRLIRVRSVLTCATMTVSCDGSRWRPVGIELGWA